jgi:hypothetical protein
MSEIGVLLFKLQRCNSSAQTTSSKNVARDSRLQHGDGFCLHAAVSAGLYNEASTTY